MAVLYRVPGSVEQPDLTPAVSPAPGQTLPESVAVLYRVPGSVEQRDLTPAVSPAPGQTLPESVAVLYRAPGSVEQPDLTPAVSPAPGQTLPESVAVLYRAPGSVEQRQVRLSAGPHVNDWRLSANWIVALERVSDSPRWRYSEVEELLVSLGVCCVCFFFCCLFMFASGLVSCYFSEVGKSTTPLPSPLLRYLSPLLRYRSPLLRYLTL